jgi:hypothetical protein
MAAGGEGDARVMLGRRPSKAGLPAFGHVNVNSAGRKKLDKIVADVVKAVQGLTKVPFHPDDEAEQGEVLTAPLKGFDADFQPKAAWSLERAVAGLRATGLPEALNESAIRQGEWSFYAVRAQVGKGHAILVRAKSPTYGLNASSKLVTVFSGSRLVPVDEPLVAFDHFADALILGTKVYVIEPRQIERLFIDADAVRARAPQTAASFNAKLAASLSSKTCTAIERVCSHNANVARRAERLIRDGGLDRVTAASVREALPDAKLGRDDFGKAGDLRAHTDVQARVLIDIAADLYYQPRFEDSPRRVASYRKLR